MINNINQFPKIATDSVEGGLDFACQLIASALLTAAEKDPTKALQYLRELAQYIEFRYVGELELAFEYLEGLGQEIIMENESRSEQFKAQLDWVKKQIGSSI